MAGLLFVLFFLPLFSIAEPPRSVVLLIGDGMGFEQVKAGRCFKGSALCFEKLPHHAGMTTYAANTPVTDSAAAATAMATGRKVNGGVVSIAQPGKGEDLETVLEIFKKNRKSVGLVTTTSLVDATPAAFGAHTKSRWNGQEVAHDYLTQTQPDILLGGGAQALDPSAFGKLGYTAATNRNHLLSLDTEALEKLCGFFGGSAMPFESDGLGSFPHLSDMTRTALNILDNDEDGFFLLVEGGRIDHACHNNDISRCIRELVEFEKAVSVAINWAALRKDVLIIVLADHETGGLTVTRDNGPDKIPSVSWQRGSHTAAPVPVYASGPNANQVTNTIDNTDIYRITLGLPAADPGRPSK